jgi:3-oxoacyl-[acyl-carrier protein] reductase
MDERVAVVTGGRRGIGRGIAYALAEQGWRIVLLDLVDDEQTQITRRALDERGAAHAFIQADVARVDQAQARCEEAVAAFGRVDCLVNNAGVQVSDRSLDVLSATVESFDRLMSVNTRGTFFLTQAFARAMLAAGPAEGFRSIITISSSNAWHAKTHGAEYCMSKSALSMMNKLMALHLAPHDIACYEIQPGLIKTDMNASLHAKYQPLVEEGLTPVRRWGTAEDVGRIAAMLAGGGLPFATGEIIHVDGGMHIPKSLFENPFVRARLS